jgi:hypothetical protein
MTIEGIALLGGQRVRGQMAPARALHVRRVRGRLTAIVRTVPHVVGNVAALVAIPARRASTIGPQVGRQVPAKGPIAITASPPVVLSNR